MHFKAKHIVKILDCCTLLIFFQILGYLSELRRSISVINTFFLRSNGIDFPKITRYSDAEISSNMMSKTYVFVLYLRILPNYTKDGLSNFNNNDLSIKNNWYNNITIIGNIRYVHTGCTRKNPSLSLNDSIVLENPLGKNWETKQMCLQDRKTVLKGWPKAPHMAN